MSSPSTEKFPNDSPEAFALEELSIGVQCLEYKNDWCTTYISENASVILGVQSTNLTEMPELWIGRIHPADVDAVRGALKTTNESNEKFISFRFRDSNDSYRWIGLRCRLRDSSLIVGVFSDITHRRILEYTDRMHFAGRNSLRLLLESSELNNSIDGFLDLLGNAMLADRAKLVRIRKDGRSFITHEWVRLNTEGNLELPVQLSEEFAGWWQTKLDTLGIVSITDIHKEKFPNAIQEELKESSIGAFMGVPAFINGVLEGFVSFETTGKRTWLPLEIEEAKHVVEGYSRSVERRIEDRKQIAEEFHLRRSEEQYRLLTAHSPVILFGINSEGIFTLSEGLGLESMGAGAGDVVGKSVYQIYRNYPDILEQVNTALAGTESHGLTHIGEKCFEVWFTPVRDEEKIVIGLSGVAVDITIRNKLEQQQTIMMSELDHRVKNNIAAVMSLVGLSRQDAQSTDEFTETLNGRLHALSVAHSTLAKSHWNGAWMKDILILTLQPYMIGPSERIHFEGHDVELPGMLARPMCMVIHELATNAAKHGALTVENGSIVITTSLSHDKNTAHLSWKECGGPPITSDIKQGTGTSLLEGLVGHEMHGSIEMDYSIDGLVCEIDLPLDTKT
ncbi:MAG: PAS domain-containing protein [Phycisphaerales bacterium]|nr:PAS domain-containing protein [Planctomycetota bacterium]MBL6997768.1 PAS domain-containing protein [Phycisphaerales bacterium]